jgi:membrane protease YdiL (CAAX protease family)
MNSIVERGGKPIGFVPKLVVLLCVALAYGSQFWPESVLLNEGMKWLGNPPYDGFTGAFLPHLLLYTTLMAGVSAVLWTILASAGWMPWPQFGHVQFSIRLGIIVGLIGVVVSIGVAWLTLPSGSVHWVPPNFWKIAGNIFSNFYEEFVNRGFFLIGLRAVFGFWRAAVISSAMWGLLHMQYPIALRIFIVVVGIALCWAARRAQSLLAPYVAHEVLDTIGDCLIG